MRDPVAEVLAERSRGGSGLAPAIILSLLMHAGGTAVAVYAGLRQPPPQQVSAVNIRFAQVPQQRAADPPVAAAPHAEPPPPRIEEPRPQPVTPPPTKAAEPPARNTAPPSPFGRSTKKAADTAPPPPTPRPPASTTGGGVPGGDIGIGEAGVTGLEGGDFPYTIYLEQMKRLIGTRWVRPQMTGQPRTVVYFRIERDGSIGEVKLMSSSGSGTFDRAAERAVREASPLPPLPYGYSAHYLGVHLTFR